MHCNVINNSPMHLHLLPATLLFAIMLITGLPAIAMDPSSLPASSSFQPRTPGAVPNGQNQDAQADKSAAYNNALAGLRALNEELKADALYEEKHCNDIALIHASSRGHTKVVSKLIEDGADVNYRSKEGILTPLIAAAEGVVPEDTCRLLIQAGCRVNDSNRDGVTALHVTAKDKYPPRDILSYYSMLKPI